MTIKEFQENAITQKNVITHQESIQGGMHGGTTTAGVNQTDNLSGVVATMAWLLGAETGTHDDPYGDWDDEGTCGDE